MGNEKPLELLWKVRNMANVNQLKGLVKERIAQAIGALNALEAAIDAESTVSDPPATTTVIADTPPIHRPPTGGSNG